MSTTPPTPTKANSPNLNFFNLPRELRNIVYDHLWLSTPNLSIAYAHTRFELSYNTHSIHPSYQHGLPTWLLTNTQLLHEGLDQLRLSATWSWGKPNPLHNIYTTHPHSKHTSTLLLPINPSRQPFLLNLEAWSPVALSELPAPLLSLEDWHSNDLDALGSFLKYATGFGNVEIYITIADHPTNHPSKSPSDVDFTLLTTRFWEDIQLDRLSVVVKSRYGRWKWWHEDLRENVIAAVGVLGKHVCKGKNGRVEGRDLVGGVATRRDGDGGKERLGKGVGPVDVWRFDVGRDK